MERNEDGAPPPTRARDAGKGNLREEAGWGGRTRLRAWGADRERREPKAPPPREEEAVALPPPPGVPPLVSIRSDHTP